MKAGKRDHVRGSHLSPGLLSVIRGQGVVCVTLFSLSDLYSGTEMLTHPWHCSNSQAEMEDGNELLTFHSPDTGFDCHPTPVFILIKHLGEISGKET